MASTQVLKTRRTEAGISRKVAADACGISQFKLDRIERGVDVDGDIVKSYTEGLGKLIAQHKPATNGQAKKQPAAKKAAAKKAPAKKATAKKQAAPKPEAPAA
jgi:hypothetical protein